GPQSWFLARYNTNGRLDTSFGTQGIVTTPSGANQIGDWVRAAVLYPSAGNPNDGKIAVVGSNTSMSGPALARYNTNGSLDTTFGSGGFPPVGVSPFGLALDASERLVVAGSSSQMALERFNAGGTPDTTFGSGGVVTAGLPGSQGSGLAIYPSTGTDTADYG